MENTNSSIKKNSELRSDARMQLSGNWGTAILLCVIYSIITGSLNYFVPYVGYVITLILAGPFLLGFTACFMHLVRREPFRFENLFDGFKRFAPAFLLELLIYLFVALWSILLIVPGIIAALRYSMSFYILNDNPEMSAMEALNASKEMMKGYKLKLFWMSLFFLGFMILSVVTLFIGMLWITPYMQTSVGNFYQNLKENQKSL